MEEKNIDVTDLAAAANIVGKQIYRIINNENVPKVTTILRIIFALGLEPRDFFDFTFDFKSYLLEQNIVHLKPKT